MKSRFLVASMAFIAVHCIAFGIAFAEDPCEESTADICTSYTYDELENFNDPSIDTSGWLTTEVDPDTKEYVVTVNTRLAPNNGIIPKDQHREWESVEEIQAYFEKLTGVPAPEDSDRFYDFEYVQIGDAYGITQEGEILQDQDRHFLFGILENEEGIVEGSFGVILNPDEDMYGPTRCVDHYASGGGNELEADQCTQIEQYGGNYLTSPHAETKLSNFFWNGERSGPRIVGDLFSGTGYVVYEAVVAEHMEIESAYYDTFNDTIPEVSDSLKFKGEERVDYLELGAKLSTYSRPTQIKALCSRGTVKRENLGSVKPSEETIDEDPEGPLCE